MNATIGTKIMTLMGVGQSIEVTELNNSQLELLKNTLYDWYMECQREIDKRKE